MIIKLEVEPYFYEIDGFSCRVYDEEIDDVRSIIVDVCNQIRHHAKFQISGFGQNQWPVTVRTDLPVFLEQLPSLINAVSNKEQTEVDFYEQGIERTITFIPAYKSYTINCASRTSWRPIPEMTETSETALLEMLRAVLETFLKISQRVSPSLRSHPWILNWINDK